MIDSKQAVTNFKRKYPSQQVTAIIDYDSHWWIVEAPENGELDYNLPYYGVNKQNGAIKTFTPMEDIEKFTNALRNRTTRFG